MFIQITKNWIEGTNIACRINLMGDEQVYDKYALEIKDEFKEINIEDIHTNETIFFNLIPEKIYEISGYYYKNKWIKFETIKVAAIKNFNNTSKKVFNSEILPPSINQKPPLQKEN